MNIYHGRDVFTHRILFGIGMALVCLSIGLPAGAEEPARRLKLKIQKRTLKVGERTQLTVEFLDRSYQKVPNDRKRELELTQVSSAAGGGVGEISPARLTVNRGAQSATAAFIAGKPGRLMIRVTSPGLSLAQVPVIIVRQQGVLLPGSLLLSVHAQPEIAVVIVREGVGPIPANNMTPAKLWIIVEAGEVMANEVLHIRVRAFPDGARFLYQGEQSPFAEIRLDEGNLASDEILVFSLTQGTLRVVAQLQPQGPRGELELEFELPQPEGIIFLHEHVTIPSNQSEVPLLVKLADRDEQPITALDRQVQIHLSSPTDPEILDFDPPSVDLTPQRPFGRSTLRLNALPSGGDILLRARDAGGQLSVGRKIITLESPIRAVVVDGPSEVNRGGKEISLRVHLRGEEDQHLAADWDRRIMISADLGKVIPTEVVIPRGQEHTNVTYQSSGSVGEATVSAESRGIASGTWKVTVVTAAYVLVLFAGLGGVLGGLSRRILVVGVTEIWPRWRQGRLEIGLVGNALFSFLFGLVLFQAIKLGVVAVPDSLAPSGNFYAGTRTFAFFFGVLGGFGGTIVLARLLRRVFPESRRQETLG